MPQFSPGENKTAVVQMTNPTGSPFSYHAELYMGTDLALMASEGFSLEAGASGEVRFEVVMPTASGEYPVYIGVWSEDTFIRLYQATENIEIVAPAGELGDFRYTVISCSAPQKPDSAWHYLVFNVDIRNISSIEQTRTIEHWEYDQGRGRWWLCNSFTITLAPGEVYHYRFSGSTVARNCTVRQYLKDNVGGQSSTCTCYS